MKSKAGRVFGGFAMQCWDSDKLHKTDEMAFIYSIDRQQIYRVIDTKRAILCSEYWGPSFGSYSLGLEADLLNKENGGWCYTNGFCEAVIYGIKTDAQGNHEVTGEGN